MALMLLDLAVLTTAVYIVVRASFVSVLAFAAIELVPLLPIIVGDKSIVAIPTVDDVFALAPEQIIVAVTSVDDVIA